MHLHGGELLDLLLAVDVPLDLPGHGDERRLLHLVGELAVLVDVADGEGGRDAFGGGDRVGVGRGEQGGGEQQWEHKSTSIDQGRLGTGKRTLSPSSDAEAGSRAAWWS